MPSRRTVLGLLTAAPASLILSRAAFAATKAEVFSFDGLAIRGYDPVAYFNQSAPVAGSPDIGLMWRGAEWRFANAENRESFEMRPEAYAPQYGGYCAYAMSLGAVATTVPEAWTIHNDRLYLNYSTEVRGIWQGDMDGNIAKADGNWPAALDG